MKISVGFTAELKPDFISRSIMKFLKTDYSHVFLIHDGIIYHSDGRGVNKIHLEYYKKTHKLVYEFPLEISLTEKEFEAYMKGAQGKEYSESQYLGFLFDFMKKWVRNGEEKMICSELVAQVLQDFGGFTLPKEADFMSPKDVYNLLKGK